MTKLIWQIYNATSSPIWVQLVDHVLGNPRKNQDSETKKVEPQYTKKVGYFRKQSRRE